MLSDLASYFFSLVKSSESHESRKPQRILIHCVLVLCYGVRSHFHDLANQFCGVLPKCLTILVGQSRSHVGLDELAIVRALHYESSQLAFVPAGAFFHVNDLKAYLYEWLDLQPQGRSPAFIHAILWLDHDAFIALVYALPIVGHETVMFLVQIKFNAFHYADVVSELK